MNAAQPSQSFAPAHHVLLLCAHAPRKDPRISWVADHPPHGLLVHVAGVDSESATEARRPTGAAELVASRALRRYADVLSVLRPRYERTIGWAVLMRIGALLGRDAGPVQRSLSQYFLDLNLALLAEGARFDGVQAVICADLDTLPAGAALKSVLGIPLLYDAHEFWPDSNSRFGPTEVEFWKGIEAELLPEVQDAFIVSSPLAHFASSLYGKRFTAVPNCEPLRPMPPADASCRPAGLSPEACVFVFQGGFAAQRGIERLIEAWPYTDARAMLVLRGPGAHFPLRQLVARSGINGKRIFVVPPVAEERLVAAARAGDVGVVPYEPASINNRYSCPNKLSQYMAAGIPVLHNRLDYVREVVAAAGCGMEADFADRPALIGAINALTADAALRARLGAAARRYHESTFHWQAVSAPLYGELGRLLAERPKVECRLYPRVDFPRVGLARRLRLYSVSGAEAAWSRLPDSLRAALGPLARSVRRLLEPRAR